MTESKRFTDNGDGTVTDARTGLMWQQATAPGTWTWKEAVDYCDDLWLAVYGGWRLPTVQELVSIVDYGRRLPAIDPVFQAESGWYWSSTTIVGYPVVAWSVSFRVGFVLAYGGRDYRYFVRAVRNAAPPAVYTDSGGVRREMAAWEAASEQDAAGVEARLAKVESDIAGMFEDWAGGAAAHESRESETLSAVGKLTEHVSALAGRITKAEVALSVACKDGAVFDQRINSLISRINKAESAIEHANEQLSDLRRGVRESGTDAGAYDLVVEQDLRDIRKLLDAASARIGALEMWRGSFQLQPPSPLPYTPWVQPGPSTPLTWVRYGTASGTGDSNVVWGPPQPMPPEPPTVTNADAAPPPQPWPPTTLHTRFIGGTPTSAADAGKEGA